MSISSIKYTDILKKNSEFEKILPEEKYIVSILSNITVSQLNDIFEYHLRSDNVNIVVDSGDYDNIVQDSLKHQKSNAIIIFWELCNIIDDLQYKIELLNKNKKILNKIENIENIEKIYLNKNYDRINFKDNKKFKIGSKFKKKFKYYSKTKKNNFGNKSTTNY